MSEIQMVEQAINEFNQDREATHLISNVCISLHTKEAAERLFKGIQPFHDDLYGDPDLVTRVLTKAVQAGVDITQEDFDMVQTWVEKGLDKISFGSVYTCLQVASLFAPNANAFDDDPLRNARFANEAMLQKWVALAIERAENTDERLHIIESVGAEYSGLRLGDKTWAATIVENFANEMDAKDAKKFKGKAKRIIDNG